MCFALGTLDIYILDVILQMTTFSLSMKTCPATLSIVFLFPELTSSHSPSSLACLPDSHPSGNQLRFHFHWEVVHNFYDLIWWAQLGSQYTMYHVIASISEL